MSFGTGHIQHRIMVEAVAADLRTRRYRVDTEVPSIIRELMIEHLQDDGIKASIVFATNEWRITIDDPEEWAELNGKVLAVLARNLDWPPQNVGIVPRVI